MVLDLSNTPIRFAVYFDDPRLRMTRAGRMVVRIAGWVIYFFLCAATVLFLLSDVRVFRALGMLLSLILVDYFLHVRHGDEPLEVLRLQHRGPVNSARFLSPASFSFIERAFDRALWAHDTIGIELASLLVSLDEVGNALERLDVSPGEFKQKLEELANGPPQKNRPPFEAIERLLTHALSYAAGEGHRYIEPSDLFAVLPLLHDEDLDRLFSIFSIEPADLGRAIYFARARKNRKHPWGLRQFFPSGHRVVNRAWTSRTTPFLDRVSADLTDLARASGPHLMLGHEHEYRQLVDVLSRSLNPNALLVGEAGAGKETLVQHFASDLIYDRVPKALFDKRLVKLHLGSLVAGAPPEELQARMERIIEEIVLAGNIILYVPDIHNLVKTSGSAFLSVADALLPIIMNNAFPFIGASYPKEFKEFLEPRSDFVGAFEVIRTEEIGEGEAIQLLIYESVTYEEKTHVVISMKAIETAVMLAKKYFRHTLLPSSARELLKDALREAERRGDSFLKPDHVIAVAEAKVHVPLHEAEGVESDELLRLEEVIHERVIGQDEAVAAVADALREYRSGLSRPGGPIATFLFLGPTGVGKTQLAKVLAEVQFGSEAHMVRFDMTEYQGTESVYRFIGSPDGSILGGLTEAVREKPYSLILLDEFEKAHPDILNLFLQVFDDGRLTDSLGRTVDFQNTIIIATSNAHAGRIIQAIERGESVTSMSESTKKSLFDIFRPELVNRFSKIIVFTSLSKKELEEVALLQLKELIAGLAEHGIALTIEPPVVAKIAEWGYDPLFGARPLRGVIEQKIKAPLATEILSKNMKKGSHVTVVLVENHIEFISE